MCEMVTEFNQESPFEGNYITKQFSAITIGYRQMHILFLFKVVSFLQIVTNQRKLILLW